MIFSTLIAIANVSISLKFAYEDQRLTLNTVLHLHGHDRLYDCLLWPVLSLGNRWKWIRPRLPCWRRSNVLGAQ